MVSLLLTFSAFAGPEDEGSGYVDPILSNWQTDVVTWTEVGSAQIPFYRTANDIIGNYWYNFGEQNSNVGQALNLTTEAWETATAPLLGNCNWCGVAANDLFYIVGRYDGSYGNEVQRFTPTGGGPTGTWEFMANYPLSMCGIAADWDGGDYIYAAGGGGSSGPVTNAYKYDIAANTWTPIASMPAAMKYHGGAFVAGEFHVVGGYQTATAHYAYDPGTDTWSTKASVPVEIFFCTFSITKYDDLLLSVGGGGGYGSWPATDAVQIYDPATDAWTQETPLPGPAVGLNSGCYWQDGIAFKGGGYDGMGYTTAYKGEGFEIPTTPVELSAFNANVVEDGVLLTWSTASELDCYEWTVQRNGVDVATLPGHGTTIEPQSYSYLDEVGAGNYTYRLKETDIGGAVTYSDEITVTVGAVVVTEYSLSGNYPNPFNPTTNIAFALPEAGMVNLSVYSLNGSLIATLVDGSRDAGVYEVTYDATGLTSGIYFFKLTAGDYSSMQKMVLLR
jgi:hypothetical protein